MADTIIIFVTDGSNTAKLLASALRFDLEPHEPLCVEYGPHDVISDILEQHDLDAEEVVGVVFIPAVTDAVPDEELDTLACWRAIFPKTPFLWVSGDCTVDDTHLREGDDCVQEVIDIDLTEDDEPVVALFRAMRNHIPGLSSD